MEIRIHLQCKKCGLAFDYNPAKNVGIQWCKECKRQYNQNLKFMRQRRKQYINRKYVIEYLLEHPCVDCGEKDIVVLDFDHLQDKKYSISVIINRGQSLSALQTEIAKCVVRCANCHRRKTAAEQNSYKLDINQQEYNPNDLRRPDCIRKYNSIRFTDEQVEAIKRDASEGADNEWMADQYNTTVGTIKRVLNLKPRF